MTDEQFEALAANFPKRTPEEAEADLQEALADLTHQSSTNASSVPKLAPKVISKPMTAIACAKEMNIYMKFDVLKHHLMKKKK